MCVMTVRVLPDCLNTRTATVRSGGGVNAFAYVLDRQSMMTPVSDKGDSAWASESFHVAVDIVALYAGMQSVIRSAPNSAETITMEPSARRRAAGDNVA